MTPTLELGQRVFVLRCKEPGRIIARTFEQRTRYDVQLENGEILNGLFEDEIGVAAKRDRRLF